jgi:hypothetical protein
MCKSVIGFNFAFSNHTELENLANAGVTDHLKSSVSSGWNAVTNMLSEHAATITDEVPSLVFSASDNAYSDKTVTLSWSAERIAGARINIAR